MSFECEFRDLSIFSEFYWADVPTTKEISSRVPNPEDKDSVKWMIRTYVIPRVVEFELREPGFRNRLVDTLGRFLALQDFPHEELERIYSDVEPVVEITRNPQDYYRWAWEVLNEEEHPSV